MTSHSITPSHSYISYESDFNTEINIDRAVKNKLCNIENEDDNLFMLKNDFFANYGGVLYKEAENLYKKNYDKNVELFDEVLYSNCKVLMSFTENNKIRCCIYKNKFDINKETRELYNFLFNIKVNSAKIKTWLECIHIVKKQSLDIVSNINV